LDDELVARAALGAVPSLSRAHARKHIAAHGSARAAVRARGIDPRLGERALARAAGLGVRAILPESLEFPAALREIPDPPLLVWLRGELAPGPALAIVGSRRASARGLTAAHAFAAELARAGVTIVSGLAYGIDSAAHEGALAGPGHTVAVLASGLDQVTPTGQQALAERILAGGGAWLSERNPGCDALARHFPERNRLISGLASVVLIVEAREKSGTLWSARHALEQGRDVAVVPGPIDTELCRGSNRLLRDGAIPILDADDLRAAVLGPLGGAPRASAPPSQASPAARAVLEHLADGPCDLDALGRALGRSSGELARVLLELELDGLVRREGTRLARTR
jgi:DNA processing protein